MFWFYFSIYWGFLQEKMQKVSHKMVKFNKKKCPQDSPWRFKYLEQQENSTFFP